MALAYFGILSGGIPSTLYWRVDVYGSPGVNFKLGTWNFFTGTFSYSATTATAYINAANPTTGTSTLPIGPYGTITLGTSGANPVFNGTQLADVQIYNVSLSSAEVLALYQEGIGGAPIDVNNLVGWWPLNGNANDYSGFSNNGNAVSVSYTNSWTSGYVQP